MNRGPTIPPESLIGQQFGRLTVISLLEEVFLSHQRVYLCLCTCGNEKIVRKSSLLQGNTKSCGCIGKKDRSEKVNNLVGRRSGKWTVLSWAGMKQLQYQRYAFWFCRCDCGVERDVQESNLLSGTSTSCGGCVERKLASFGDSCPESDNERFYRIFQMLLNRVSRKNEMTAWKSYHHFREDMLESYRELEASSKKFPYLHRWDERLPFCKENCYWSIERNSNRRKSTQMIQISPTQQLTTGQIAKIAGVSRQQIYNRLKAGWLPEDLLAPRQTIIHKPSPSKEGI